ncbi:dihydrofolate reductase [Alkalicoccus halolimnae]|uniref:Dihydrofolate reductase n=1 Tax=Alkalicoccus halolimnae TaxID=1667239 RepID=A0A5C7F2A3_9BACI|nr:dihydrofolate reductase [Alkalicoccus halolimnae]TXF84275.1 dihydrofolate reductase [Alkalicoccus halolimnae]
MISMIAAMDRGRVIGKDGGMPWHLPNDLKFFKATTYGKTIVMGRKTFESIGKPLPGRRNIVLTSNPDFKAEGIEVYHDPDEIRALETEDEELVIMGGASLYEKFMKDATRIYLTKIEADFEGDTFFPELIETEWTLVSAETGTVDEKNVYPHVFQILERNIDSLEKM